MRVGELIELLNAYDEHDVVMISADGNALDDVVSIEKLDGNRRIFKPIVINVR